MRPKLVSKKSTSGILISCRVRASIFIVVNVDQQLTTEGTEENREPSSTAPTSLIRTRRFLADRACSPALPGRRRTPSGTLRDYVPEPAGPDCEWIRRLSTRRSAREQESSSRL